MSLPPPPLSVVMPVHDGMPFVAESVASLLGQSFADFELVIGDDGSTDGSSEVLSDFAGRDPRIRLLRRERKSGLAASGNWVVGAARAPLVAIAHADDVARPERLERQFALLSETPDAVLVASLSEGTDATGRVVRPADLWRLTRRSPFAPFTHSAVSFRRAAFVAVGGYRAGTDYWEDLDLYWRLSGAGRILVLPEVHSTYRHSAVSVRRRAAQEAWESSVQRMYASAEAFRNHRDYDHLAEGDAAPPTPRRRRPRILLALMWERLWTGQRPGVLRRLVGREMLGPNLPSLWAVLLAGWATASPKSMRLAVQLWIGTRNRLVRRSLSGRRYVEWRPREPAGR